MNTQVPRDIPYKAEVTVASTPLDRLQPTPAEAHATLQQVTNTTPHEAWGEDAGL